MVANTADASTQGAWQFSSNGTNWEDIGVATTDSGVLVDKDSLLRFVPFTDYNGTPPGLTVHAVEDSTGDAFSTSFPVAIEKFDTDLDSEITSYVSHTGVSVSITVTPTNDIPTGDDVDFTSNVAEDDSDPSGESVNSLFSSVFLDPIDAATDQLADEFKGIAIATNDSTSTQVCGNTSPMVVLGIHFQM